MDTSTPHSQTLAPTVKSCRLRFAALILLLLPLTAAGISYSDRCDAVVREPPLLPDPNPPLTDPKFLALRHTHVDCANKTTKEICVIPKSISFRTQGAYRTQKDTVFKIEAVLRLFGMRYPPRRGLRLVHFRPPRIPVTTRGGMWSSEKFTLSGFWDSTSGKLCMIGSGLGKLSSNHVVLKLDYLNSSSIFSSLVNGTLESLDVDNQSGVDLKSLSILGVNLKNYKYELIDKEIESKKFQLPDMSSVSLGVKDLVKKMCTYIQAARFFELGYESDCSSVNCNFLGKESPNFMPSVMNMNEIECLEDGRVRFLLGFGDIGHNGFMLPFHPNTTLVSEGKWDANQKRLNLVGCRIFSNWDDGSVGECLIRLSLRFPAQWTLGDRSTVVGELWSSRNVNETGYFSRVILSSVRNNDIRAPNLKYEYTEIDNTKKLSCANKTIQKGERKTYPSPLSPDMRFNVIARNNKVSDLLGFSSPVFVGSQHYQLPSVFQRQHQNLSNMTNISYVISLTTSHDFKLSRGHKQIQSFDISAEGIYDSETGHLCMIGCMQVGPPKVRVMRNLSLDCQILVDIQYHPVNANNGQVVKGTIKSRREKSDSLYFEPFEIASRSIYAEQAKDSIWRMDLEITMVLISNTLSCVFVGLQLLHVKTHANALPLISVVMLTVLTLGHLIPLLLNFEALFTRGRNNVNFYFGGNEWLEVNEVLVRVITMVAFLLESRLLQITWSARSSNENQKNLWMFEKKVLYLSGPLYIGGGLIAWFVHLSRKPYKRLRLGIHRFEYQKQSLWGNLKSYGGLVSDGFLLPQILFNLFSDSKEKAVVAPSFYMGITVVRLLPHAYDLYRSHSSTWSFSYIYANPGLDYYSTAWDVIISVGGLLFVFLIYLQQRYGGRCIVPRSFWRTSYEKVPVAAPE